MKKLVKFFIGQSKVVNLIVFAVIVVGTLIFWKGQKEGFPLIKFDVIWISTSYFGASAEEVEKLVTDKIEDAVEEVDGAKRITSRSIEGLSTVIYQVDSDYSHEVDKILDDIKNAVDGIQDLPEDAKDPMVREIDSDIFPVISVFLSGKIDETQLRKLALKVEDDLKKIEGVGKVEKEGYRKKQVWIEANPEKLKYFNINLMDIIGAIRLRNINLPGGKISISRKEYLIRTVGEYKNLNQIKNTVIRANDEGKSVRVKDVATVSWNFEKTDISYRVNGTTGLNLNVMKKKSGDTIRVADAVKALIERYKKEKLLPKEAEMFFSNDLSWFVKRRLSILSNNAFIGLIMVFLTLIIFFDWKTTFWTTLGIPVACCGAMLTITMMGMTLNMMTMFGFIIVVGMIVDDAIIVSENIYRHREMGASPLNAAINGTAEVLKPVLATVVTTIAAFMPLVGLPGIMGKFLKFIPIIISITMLASLIECIFVLPGHIAHIRDKRGKKKDAPVKSKNAGGKLQSRKIMPETRTWFKKLQKKYVIMLTKLLKKPLRNMIGIIILAFILLIITSQLVPFEMVSGKIDQFDVQIECDIDYSIEQTKKVADRSEKVLRKAIGDQTREFISTVGIWNTSHGPKMRVHYIGITLILDPDRKMSDKEIREAIGKELDKIKGIETYDAKAVKGGPPQSSPVKIHIFGNRLNKMEKIAEEVRMLIASISNTTSLSISLEQGKDEFILDIDEAKAAMLGVNINSAALSVRHAFEGGQATTANSMTGLNEDVNILVKFNEKRAKTLSNLKTVQIKNNRGRYISLNKFASFKKKRSVAMIEREDSKRVIAVSAELKDMKNKRFNSDKINKMLENKIGAIRKKYPDNKIEFTGEKEEQEEMKKGGIKAGIIALVLIFIILTALFKSISQPLFVMAVIPFSMVGVMVGLLINFTPMGILPMMGMIALMGVVVNDSLVLVSFVNRLRLQGMDKLSALIEAGKTRLRPIILTTVTTVVGLIPMSYGIMGSSSFLQPMGIALIWGLLFATTITLFILPCMYYLGDGLIARIYRFFNREYVLPGSLEQ